MGYRRSSVPNLYRDERTGIYYVRTKVHGRTIWKTLQTNEFRVAKLRAQGSWAICRKVDMHCPRWRGALPPLAAWPNCIEGASSPIHVSSRHQKPIGARP